MTVTLHGLPYTARGPALFQQQGYPVTIGFDGQAWRVAVRGIYGTREFSSRDEAAELVAIAFTTAEKEFIHV